jgi:hypothetical protein
MFIQELSIFLHLKSSAYFPIELFKKFVCFFLSFIPKYFYLIADFHLLGYTNLYKNPRKIWEHTQDPNSFAKGQNFEFLSKYK